MARDICDCRNPRCTPAYPKCPPVPTCARCGCDGNDVTPAEILGGDRHLCAECLPLAMVEYDTTHCVAPTWADGTTFGGGAAS